MTGAYILDGAEVWVSVATPTEVRYVEKRTGERRTVARMLWNSWQANGLIQPKGGKRG